MSSKYAEIDLDPYTRSQAGDLREGTVLPVDVFIREGSVTMPLFYNGTSITGDTKAILRERGITDIYIRSQDVEGFAKYRAQARSAEVPQYDPKEFRRYSAEKEQLFSVDRSILTPGTSVPFSLFYLDRFDVKLIAEASETAPHVVDGKTIAVPGDIVIRNADLALYRTWLGSLLKQKAPAGGPPVIQPVVLRETSKLLIKDLLDDPRSGEKIKESVVLVNGMVDAVLHNPDAVSDLLTLNSYDYYTYTHCVNVAALAVGLGIAAGLPRDAIERLGIGAMLHDVGKSRIPHEILNKPGKLDDREYAIMKSHVVEGEHILRDHHDIPPQSFDAVVQHHERLSGGGYPFHRAGGDLSVFGRLASIVDCYDAITTRRPYQPANTPFFALSVMTRQSGEYDQEFLKLFIRMLGAVKK